MKYPPSRKKIGLVHLEEEPVEESKLRGEMFTHSRTFSEGGVMFENSFIWTEEFDSENKLAKKPRTSCMCQSSSYASLVWSLTIMVSLLWVVVMTPFQLAFWNDVYLYDIEPSFWECVELVDLVVDVLFWADVVVSFRTTYVRVDGSIEDDPKKVALNYLKTHFFIDLLSCLPGFPVNLIIPPITGMRQSPFPFDPFFFEQQQASVLSENSDQMSGSEVFRVGKVSKVVRVIRFTKTARLFRCGRLMSSLEERFQCSMWIVRMSLIFILFFMLSHIVACFFVFFAMWDNYEFYTASWIHHNGLMENDPSSEYSLAVRQYVGALYWAVMTLTTVGYGDMMVESTAVRLYAIFVMFVGGIVFAIILSSVNSVIESATRSNKILESQLDEVRTWVRERKIGQKLSSKIYRYFRYYYRQKSAADEMRILSEISEPLKEELREHLVGNTLDKLSFFTNLDTNAIMLLLNVLKPLQLLPHETLCEENDEGSEMFFLLEGLVQLSSSEDGGNPRTLRAPCAMGEFAMLGLVTLRAVTITAMTDCSLYSLSNADVFRVFENYPEILSDITKRAVMKFKGLFHRLPDEEKMSVVFASIAGLETKTDGDKRRHRSHHAVHHAVQDQILAEKQDLEQDLVAQVAKDAEAIASDESKSTSLESRLRVKFADQELTRTKPQPANRDRDVSAKQPDTEVEDGRGEALSSFEVPGRAEGTKAQTRRHTIATDRVSHDLSSTEPLSQRRCVTIDNSKLHKTHPATEGSTLHHSPSLNTTHSGLLRAVEKFGELRKRQKSIYGSPGKDQTLFNNPNKIRRSRTIHNVAKIIGTGESAPETNSHFNKGVVTRLESIELGNQKLMARVRQIGLDITTVTSSVNGLYKDISDIRANMDRLLSILEPHTTTHTTTHTKRGKKKRLASPDTHVDSQSTSRAANHNSNANDGTKNDIKKKKSGHVDGDNDHTNDTDKGDGVDDRGSNSAGAEEGIDHDGGDDIYITSLV